MLKQARHTMIWLATAMMLMTGCQYDGVVADIQTEDAGSDTLAISFGDGVIDALLRTKAVTLLSDHTYTMGVWGWQTSKSGKVGRLFLNQEVTFNPELGRWTYSPQKYWDAGSSYRFYAYAPHSTKAGNVTVSIDQETGFISLAGVTLKGSNTMDTLAQPKPTGKFGSEDDIDWLIDRAGKIIPKEQIHGRVTFNLQHILAKFNVMVNTNKSFGSTGMLTLDSIVIGQFHRKADFTQQLNHTPSILEEADQAVTEWVIDTQSEPYSICSTKNLTVTEDDLCVIESLLVPQEITDSQTVQICYSIHPESGQTNRFVFTLNLNEAFGSIECSNNYTLHINLGPDIITFDAGTDVWNNEPASYEWIVTDSENLNLDY